jgi:hypothetical protein
MLGGVVGRRFVSSIARPSSGMPGGGTAFR